MYDEVWVFRSELEEAIGPSGTARRQFVGTYDPLELAVELLSPSSVISHLDPQTTIPQHERSACIPHSL